MSIALIVSLIILGIICLLLEFLVIPGAIVGIIGSLMIVGGIVGSYVEHGAMVGNITLITTLIVLITGVVLMLRSNTWKKLMLKTNIESKVNEIDENKIQVGMEGMAISRLAPMGKGRFNNETIEVSSSQGFIDENSTIIITRIEGNKVIVKLK